MTCPHCQTDDTQKLAAATGLGYCRFRCRQCGCRFNERTGTPFNHLEFPTDIVFQVVLFRLLFKLSLRDLVRRSLICSSTHAMYFLYSSSVTDISANGGLDCWTLLFACVHAAINF